MGPEEGVNLEEISKPKLEKLTSADIKSEIPGIGETSIVLQCNAKDDRDKGSPDIGRLIPEEAKKAREIALEHFRKIFEGLSEEERRTIDVLVVASDASLNTETGIIVDHKRAVATAKQVIGGLSQAMGEFGVPPTQLLNSASSKEGEAPKPIELSQFRDLRMMEESPEFVQYMIDQEGAGGAFSGAGFWAAYETDKYKQKREEMGVEGPEDIADRMASGMVLLALASAEYHQAHPGRRLIIWANSHYDSMSPLIKRYVSGMDRSEFLDTYMPVDKKGGLTFKLDGQGALSTDVQGHHIDLSQT